MSDEPTPSPLLIVIAAGVLAITGLVLWSSGALFSSSDTVVTEKPRTPRVISGQSAAEDKTTESNDAVAKSEVIGKPPVDALLEKIKAMLKKGHSVPDEALLTFKSQAELHEFLRNASKYGLKVIATLNGLKTVRVGFTDEQALANYMAAAGAKAPSMEANHWMTVPTLPKADPNNQGGHVPVGDKLMASINALGDRTHWGDGVTVAVLDTGVKAHPTFGENQITHIDLVKDGKEFHPHGTSVASLIAGQDDRVPGVAPGTNILDIRVANDKGISVSSVLAEGIVMAVDDHAQVINISLGGYDDSEVLRSAVAYADSRQVLVVAAAGNEGYDKLAYPAAIPHVISVGAVDGNNQQAYFSNSGSGLAFAAPGVGLTTAWIAPPSATSSGSGAAVASVSGTSQSTGVVSGVVAANYSNGITYARMIQQMQADAYATGASSNKVGNGVIQVYHK